MLKGWGRHCTLYKMAKGGVGKHKLPDAAKEREGNYDVPGG